MNLLQAFGIDEATDKLCKIAGIEVMDWQRMTVRVIRPSAIILDECGDTACKKCGEETGWGFQYCSSCRF